MKGESYTEEEPKRRKKPHSAEGVKDRKQVMR